MIPISCFLNFYPRVFRRKKGDYVLPFVVRIRPSVRKQFTSISSYTIDARITKPICMIPLCIQMVATYLKFFYIFQFWNNSDFSDFTQKCNFSGNFSRNWFKFFKCMGESLYIIYQTGFIMWLPDPLRKWKYRWRGADFERKLFVTSVFFHGQFLPLYIQMVATYLKFFYIFQFWNNSDFSDFTQKCNFSGNFSRNWFKFFKCMGESHLHHISNRFYHVTSDHLWKWKYRWRGADFERKLLLQFTASPPTLLMLE